MKINNSSSEKKISIQDKIDDSSTEEKVKILFYDETSIEYSKNFIDSMSSSLLYKVPKYKEYYIIRAPYGITKNDFSQFLHIYSSTSNKNEKYIGNDSKKLFPILKLMDFFNNEKSNVQIITNIILPELNSNIAIDLIIFSYDKLCYFSEIGQEVDNAYFELFYQALEELSKNEMLIIQNIDKLKALDGRIIEELMQKTFRNLIFGKYLIEVDNDDNDSSNNIDHIYKDINQANYFESNEINSSEFNKKKKLQEKKNDGNTKIINIKNLKNLIEFLMKINNLDNIFSLLTKEFMSLLSSESINELQSLPNPSFQVKIPVSIYETYYEEFPLDININSQLLTLVIFYKIGDKSINACIKLSSKNKDKNNNNQINEKKSEISNNKYNFEILTFLTNVLVTKGQDKRIITIQNNLTSLNNSKSMYSILKVPHFENEISNSSSTSNTNPNIDINNANSNIINNKLIVGINNENTDDYFLITVQIKLCYIYSVISSYLLRDFNNYVNDANISKLSKQLFILLIKNQKLNKKSENNLMKSILLWLDDEINIKEDISEIFYIIKWEKIDDDLIFELLIKYSHIILNDENLENYFLDIYISRFGQNEIVKSIILKLFKAIKKIEYHKLFSQIKKDEKIIENYKSYRIKNENIKQSSRKIIKKNEVEIKQGKKYNNEYTQTDPIKTSGSMLASILDNKKDNNHIKQDYSWNTSKIKNNSKEKNNSKSPSLNDFNKNKQKENIKKENNDISKSKSKSGKSTDIKEERFNKKIHEKNITKKNEKININIYNINKSPNIKGKQKNNPQISKSNNKPLNNNNKVINNKNKSDKKENYKISNMKKSDGKIKQMLIFPYNFSVLKKFENSTKNDSRPNSNLNTKMLNKKKSNRIIKNNIDISISQDNFVKDRYYTGRNFINRKNKRITSRSRPRSENNVKISMGIIKEIRFMNNNL